jgi:hypothetical protein
MASQSDNMRHLIAAAALLTMTSMTSGCGKGGPLNEHTEMTINTARALTDSETSSPLKKWCGDCHAPPKPSSHKSQEWPNIVARMQDHRITQGLAKIDDQALSKLVTYLQNHAQP